MLLQNADMFAWTTTNMLGVDLKVITYKLFVYKDAWLIAQEKRKLGDEKKAATKEEVEKLLEARFIREAKYTT